MEEWKDVPGYEWLYKASNLGNIKSLYFWKERIIKSCSDWRGYLHLLLVKNKIRKDFKEHRLICLTFLDNPDNKKEVNHKDGNRLNNRLENLEWCTRSENEQHKYNILWQFPPLKWKFWKLHHWSKKVKQYSKGWKFIKQWESWMDIQRELWISQASISACCRWKIKTSGGFTWEY